MNSCFNISISNNLDIVNLIKKEIDSINSYKKNRLFLIKDEKSILEKFIKQIAILNLKQSKMENYSDIHIEFWVCKSFEKSLFHLDCDELAKYPAHNYKNIKRPLITSATYINDNDYEPTIVSNLTEEKYKYKDIEDIELIFSFPRLLKHFIFNGGEYYHTGFKLDKEQRDRYVIFINIWNEKPTNVNYYSGLSSEPIKEKINIFFNKNKIINYIYLDNTFDREFYENLLYRDDFSVLKKYDNIFENINKDGLVIVKNKTNQLLEENRISIDHKYDKIYTIKKFYSNDICNWIINESEKYALDNNGWFSDRHENYPTIDLPLNKINNVFEFFKVSYSTIIKLIKECYKIEEKYIFSIHDAFIVKYDINLKKSLESHHDGSDLTISILLNNNFTGGGTFFEEHKSFHLKIGDMLIHQGSLKHSGLPIDSGIRYLLVVFIKIYNSDNFDEEENYD